ncbi:MAG: hypothetical protein DMF69_22485, partial [Acidobacteria bacterium]
MRAITAARFGITWQKRAPSSRETGGYLGVSHDQNFKTWFGKSGLTVLPTGSEKRERDWRMNMRLQSYGYGNALAAAPPIVSRKTTENRIEYVRSTVRLSTSKGRSVTQSTIPKPQLIEWYENGPSGIEQGFKVINRPKRRGAADTESLRVTLSVAGDLCAKLKGDGKEIELIDKHGERALSYSKLVARDADGRELVARMETKAEGREIVLVVDDQHASYPIMIDPLMWSQQNHLIARDGGVGDRFGFAVAISGNTAVVGAYHDSFLNGTPGLAYVFIRTGKTWTEQSRLRTDEVGTQGGKFGWSVAISGNTVVVGASYMDIDVGTGVSQAQGAAYVFVRTGTIWEHQSTLTTDDVFPGSYFGYSVAISGDTVVVGSARDAAYVFVRSGTRWSQPRKLVQSDPLTGRHFGHVVSISGDTVVVGGWEAPTPLPPDEPASTGSIYVFVRNGGTWTEQAKVMASDRIVGDLFGSVPGSIGINGDTLIVGYYNIRNSLEHPDRHGAYVYVRSAGSWSLQVKLTGGQPQSGSSVVSVAIDKNKAVLGYSGGVASNTPEMGSAYIFERRSGMWFALGKLDAPNVLTQSLFGYPVAISGESTIVGASLDPVETHLFQGSAYIFANDDTDGDGLPDDWETNGITVNAAGDVVGTGNLVGQGTFINVKAMGADPKHKDVFVHADWMRTGPSGIVLKPSARLVKMVSDAFAVAPVDNPDGKKGIRLHVDLGPNSIMNPVTGARWNSLSRAVEAPFQEELGTEDIVAGKRVYNWTAYDDVKATSFGAARRRPV